MADPVRILVVEDEVIQRTMLVDYLTRYGFHATGLADGFALRQSAHRQPPDLVLLDLHLPGEDGLSLLRHLRQTLPEVAIIMVTIAGETIDRIVGLEAGADDYLPKPFEPRELLARIRSVLRRTGRVLAVRVGARVAMGRRILDLERRMLVGPDGEEEALAPTEFELLRLFAENPNRPLQRDWLLDATSRGDPDVNDRAMDLRIGRLRRKIEVDPAHPEAIRTVRGVGYMFVPPGTPGSNTR